MIPEKSAFWCPYCGTPKGLFNRYCHSCNRFVGFWNQLWHTTTVAILANAILFGGGWLFGKILGIW